MGNLTLIRHGATATTKGVFRLGDDALTGEGKKMAAATARYIGGGCNTSSVPEIFTSPSARSLQTSEMIAERIGSSPITDDALRDISLGSWAGRSFKDVETIWPDEWRQWLTAPDELIIPGGEGLEDLRARSLPKLYELLTSKRDAIVVTHRAVIMLMVMDIMDAPMQSFWRLPVAECSITKILPSNVVGNRDVDSFSVGCFNQTAHLELLEVAV